MIGTTRELLAQILWEYGEDSLAERASTLTDAEMKTIGEVSARVLYAGPSRLIDLALARGAIEVLEGAPREPARKRRRKASPT
jgi:hypothetical protein